MHEEKTSPDDASSADGNHRNPPSSEPTPIERLLRPFQTLMHAEASGGLLLLAATALATV
jgi:hypothetical protein